MCFYIFRGLWLRARTRAAEARRFAAPKPLNLLKHSVFLHFLWVWAARARARAAEGRRFAAPKPGNLLKHIVFLHFQRVLALARSGSGAGLAFWRQKNDVVSMHGTTHWQLAGALPRAGVHSAYIYRPRRHGAARRRTAPEPAETLFRYFAEVKSSKRFPFQRFYLGKIAKTLHSFIVFQR